MYGPYFVGFGVYAFCFCIFVHVVWFYFLCLGEKRNLQDTFLNNVRKEKNPVTVFLVNGVKLQGVITWFDNFCVLLRRDGAAQLVYKHAISTIMPTQPLKMYDGESDN